MKREDFYKQLAETTEKLGITWKLVHGSLRGKNKEHTFCPITAVAALYDPELYDYNIETDAAAEALKLRNYSYIVDAADMDKYLSEPEKKVRKKLLEATGLND